MKQPGLLILDFGSQVTMLIARRLREMGYYCEIQPYNWPITEIRARAPIGIILSGGHNSVYEMGAPKRNIQELSEVAPLMGICYGMQLMAHSLGGEVRNAKSREYGFAEIEWSKTLGPIPKKQKVWMSHGDVVLKAPPGAEIVANSKSGSEHHAAALLGPKIFGVQFHPEVAHTENGMTVLQYFAEMCGAEPDWTAPEISATLIEQIRKQVPKEEHVLCALSGGVDSSVVATLLTKALGAERVHCVFVDHGLLRLHESEMVQEAYQKVGLNVQVVDARDLFMRELNGVSDPEIKRKTIGRLFIEVFEKSIQNKNTMKWLAQGTLYPDVIESVSLAGGQMTIKSHHNVGGLPEKMNLRLIEPVRDLFKDEVRALGLQLGLPVEMLGRHPFPGPGLAIRVLGPLSEDRIRIAREADAVFINALKEKGLYDRVWQAFCVLLPVQTVGVQGDGRTYENVLALRAVTSKDGMTADWYPFEFEFLREVSNRITNQVRGVNRVVYDVTSKPPGTIEWE